MVTRPVPDRLGELLECDEDPPPEFERRILALGDEARGPLLEIVRDPSYRELDAAGDGLAPYNAIRLLARLGSDDAAIAACIDVVHSCAADVDHHGLAYEAAYSLGAMGRAAVPALVAAYAAASGDAVRRRFANALAASEERSDAVLEVLLDWFGRDPESGACLLAEHGDARALPAIHQAFEATVLEADRRVFGNHALFELEDAVLSLGGALTASETARVDAAHRARRSALLEAVLRQRNRATFVAPPRTGPNAPCPCGSGRKFKKCCAGDPAPDPVVGRDADGRAIPL